MRLFRRPLARACLLLAVAACAQMDPPPGGPEDRTPPYVVVQQPDSLAVVPDWSRPVTIEFSERISERQVEEAVMVSPRTSPVVVDRGSRSLRVSLRRGWEPGQIYQVTVRPVIQDLFSNTITDPVEVVFSTGPEIPNTRLAGIVRDRITGEPEPDARVEAIRQPDSLVYAVPSDSAGRFVFAYVPEGEYLVRAFPDVNRNREPDIFEARDSLTASITTVDTADVQLSLVLPDSTAPIIASVSAGTEGRVDVRFDDYLDPAQPVDPAAVTITGPDGATIAIAVVTIGEPPPLESDTLPGGVADTLLAGAADTIPVGLADTIPVGVADTIPAAGADTIPSAGPDTIPPLQPDTAAGVVPDSVPAPQPVLPSQLLVVQLAEGVTLTPEAEYRVAVVGMRNLVGLVGDSDETFTAPVPPPPPEEAEAPDEPEEPGAQPADTVPVVEPPPGP